MTKILEFIGCYIAFIILVLTFLNINPLELL